MCNLYEHRVAFAEYEKAMAELGRRAPALPPLDFAELPEVRITERAPVIVTDPAGEPDIAVMRFSWIGERGAPVFNFRSDGRRFAGSRRCLIPASAFFEFKGPKAPKAKFRFTLASEPVMAIAGIWRPPQGNQPGGFAMLTTEPGADMAPIHSRQIVVLARADWRAWLDLSRPEGELLRPLPAGSLIREQVR
jgi:putative SOS response-associated peptidase YedK